jgi:hypothetical protein
MLKMICSETSKIVSAMSHLTLLPFPSLLSLSDGTSRFSSHGGSCHLKVYHLISMSKYGLMVQMLAGLITYVLLTIYCHDQHHEKASVKRLIEISINIRNLINIAYIVNQTGVWLYKPPNQDQLHTNL